MIKSDQATSVLNCTYCQNNLENISILCAKCHDFSLCLKCFSMSAEIGEHKKEHDYRIRSLNSYFPIFDSDKLWSFKEENFLLAYIEQYGFGNWDEISKNFETRNAKECMEHYFAYYIYGNIGKYSLNNVKKLKDKNNNIDHTISSHDDPTEITVLLPPIEISSDEQRALGYMPLRDDFEREFKNDAETLLSNLTIGNDDDETDIDVKISLAKVYREILLDRHRLKKIAREYGLINNASALINKHKNSLNTAALVDSINKKIEVALSNDIIKKRRRDDELGDINENFKKYAQLCNPSFYENLIENMRERNRLISRLEELKKYRENGIRTFKEIETFKEEKIKRETKSNIKIIKNNKSRRSPPTQLNNKSYKSTNDLIVIEDNHNNTTNLSCASSASSHDSNSIITNVSNYSSSIGSLDHNNLIINNRRNERLCSMPGYNLLSENEKKNNLTRNHSLRTSSMVNDSMNVDELDSTTTANNNSMLLRQQNSTPKNKKILLKRLNNSKLFTSFPNYNQIPRTTRKRIFRFLCDNGWINI